MQHSFQLKFSLFICFLSIREWHQLRILVVHFNLSCLGCWFRPSVKSGCSQHFNLIGISYHLLFLLGVWLFIQLLLGPIVVWISVYSVISSMFLFTWSHERILITILPAGPTHLRRLLAHHELKLIWTKRIHSLCSFVITLEICSIIRAKFRNYFILSRPWSVFLLSHGLLDGVIMSWISIAALIIGVLELFDRSFVIYIIEPFWLPSEIGC